MFTTSLYNDRIAKGGGESSSEGVSNRNKKNATPRAERGRVEAEEKARYTIGRRSIGEGIAPSAVKGSFRQRESIPRSEFSSGRPYIKKEKSEYDIQHMEQEMKLLLRDDFIDDGDDSNSGDESMKPVIFPVKEIKGKQEKLEKDEEKPENFQNQDFAKTMGFNVEKIAKFIKKEKTEDADLVAEPDWSKVPRNEVTELLTSRDSPFFLLQIPQCITTQANDYQSKAVENPVSSDEKKNVTTLASMSEGTIGKLQILKSGRARLKIGSLDFYISDMCPLIGKHELVSIKIDSGSVLEMDKTDERSGPDFDRIGLFKEMSYLEYVPTKIVLNEASKKGKQMMTNCTKSKNATQDGYFRETYPRVFEGEAYMDPIRLRRLHRLEQDKKIRDGKFIYANPPKKPCGSGSNYGTFDDYIGKTEYFSSHPRDVEPSSPPKKNFFVNPGKKGTGYGKKDGGMKAGCLNKFPEHTGEPYPKPDLIPRGVKHHVNKENQMFRPVPGPKPYPVKSIITKNVQKKVTPLNFPTIKGVVYCKK
ncbi:UPF0602 protein C4orf47 like protein [Argiope bruennichi]|uniref:Cilia-and flagella-associated protein 96 n=1 Tax=Argiope bruennichi TaxID=94029 RepID=A0A8T0EFU3_ARGBR|nr:UPF0602 protein C4orf47 like protein [Argiope bruennichi]